MQNLSPDSYWRREKDSDSPAAFPPWEKDGRVDVAIVGAGITGLTTALHLRNSGHRVAILEAGQVGAGTSGGTSGHLEVMPDRGWVALARDFGEAAARRITLARAHAIDQIEQWIAQFQIECGFRRIPALAFTEHGERMETLHAQYQSAVAMGLDVSWQASAELPFPTAAALRIKNQARFDALAYLRGLAKAVVNENVTIHEQTRVEPPKDGSPCVLQVNGHRLLANSVVLATHSSFLGISQFELRQAAYQSYVVAARVSDDVPDALYWDDDRPYHYLRLAASADPRLLIVGGADHKTGQADSREHAEQLVQYVSDRFSLERIEHQWSAEYFEPADGLPFIGRVPLTEHLYMATGYSGTGLTYGTVAGRVLAEAILGQPSAMAKLFSPSRIKPIAAAKDFVSENFNAAVHFVGDRLGAEQATSLASLAPGEGRLVKFDDETYAAYRDDSNRLHLLSPVCTHAGCFVQWNNTDQTWDCPCHGGRFSATGQRLYGPPALDLYPKQTSRYATCGLAIQSSSTGPAVMIPYRLSKTTLVNIRELIEANFAGRDELYAALETLDDEAKKNICRRLAEHLAGHAVELEQILTTNGHTHYDLADVEFIDHLTERAFLEMVKDLHGEATVMAAIEQCERNLKDKYDRLLAATPEPQAEGVLQRQRQEVEFGEQVLHTMHDATDNKPPAADPT